MPSKDPLIKLEDISKIYYMGEVIVHALKKINLEIRRGEFVVLLGPSGSGKTTTLNLIGGMDSPTEGKILVDDIDIAGFNESELTEYRKRSIGFVFQFFNLIPTLTAKENVELAAELVERSRKVSDVLNEVGLRERGDHFPSELSGGEQQRVAIARALVKDPPILLCDEPTGNLDFETGKRILSTMRQINKHEYKTFIIVTHNTAIAEIADRVVRLQSGEIGKIGNNKYPLDPEELRW